MAYTVITHEQARKDQRKLPKHVIEGIDEEVERLEANPRHPGCKPLKGFEDTWRVVVRGDYRIVYVIDDGNRTVSIVRIRHRKEVYR